MKKSNIFASIPTEIKEETFEEILSKDGVKIERIISDGHVTPDGKWYEQEDDEWVMLIQGEAILEFENSKEVKLFAGDYINIPALTKHRVSWTKPNFKTIWLAVHY
ncbi:cupin domain-containing protein [Sulfurimonas sp.]|uniref:cupin domain-containing protein n=1 Tax=Sulfurimonas sp. TaxID=2022749 RepID=UPI002AB1C744|nr:cupin domain-containing protein [Sulfurimonas sp.]